MAGKKKNKGALDDQHVKNINTNFDHYRKFPIAKEDYWRNIAKAKQPEADALWDRLLKKSEEEQAATAGAAAARAESRAQDDSIKSSTTASSLTHVKVSSSISAGSPTAVGVNTTKATITDTPASAMPGHDRIASDLVTGSWTTPAVGTQDVSPDEGYDEVHELVNKESTSRDMPDPVRGETRLSNGTVHKINEHNVRSFLSKVDPSTAIYPIRNGMLEQTTELFTNRYEVCIDEGATLHEFHIVGIPEGRSRRMTKMFVDTAIERSFVLNSNKHHFATDYMKKIISWKDLREDFKSQGAGDTQTNSWHLVDVKDDDRTVHIYLQHIRVVDTAGLRRYVASEPAGPGWDPMQWQEETTMEALNIVIAKCFDGNIVRAAPNKFFVEAGWQRLGNSPLCTIRGYYFSARPGMGSILLNVNACTSAFFLPVQLGELMRDSHHFGRDYPSVLTGLRVYISYERGRTDKAKSSTINEEHSRIKRICELGQACNRQTFKFMQHKEDGSFLSEDDITVADYLSQEYNITLRMPDLPAVNLGSWMRPCWFPPEELYIMPYQIYQRAVPTALTAAMLNTACHPPDHSAGLIEGEGMSRLLLNQNPKPPYLRTVPLKIGKDMLKIGATRLAYPRIMYGNKTQVIDEHRARWNLQDSRFLKTNDCTVAYAFLPEDGVQDRHITGFRGEFCRQLRELRVGMPQSIELHTGPIRTRHSACNDDIRARLREAKRRGANVAVLVLRSANQDVYSTFKYLADRVFGIASIVMVEASGYRGGKSSGLAQYIGNIMMKANLKMGGINHSAESKQGNIKRCLQNTLVLGADVTHPSGGALLGCPSVAALVGSVENTGGKFLGSLSLQSKGKKEIIDNLGLMVRERLSDWCKQNSNSLPDNILYYRDGVSDAQVEHVKDEELPQIRDSFNAFAAERETNPKARLASVKITAVVCTKRHHTRIYPLNQQDIQQGNGNCKPGTLVERSITSPYFTDFYLQSHNGIKGTAKPAHYWVLLNEMNLPISELQHLTYNLCLTYVRATLGVSYAAPAYYADRLCERARCYLRDFFSPSRQRRNELDQSRYRYEKDEGLWTPQAQVEKMTPVEKEKERARVKEKKERVEKRLMESVMREAGRRFEARDKDDRVDRDRDEGACRDLLRTMYWM